MTPRPSPRRAAPERRPEVRLLAALAQGAATSSALVRATRLPEAEVDRLVVAAAGERLVERVDAGRLRLTERGEGALAAWSGRLGGPAPAVVDLRGLAHRVGELGQAASQGRRSAVERSRAGHLIEPAAREHAVDTVNAAYVAGVVDLDERERRVSLALAAGTRGDLVRALDGLGPLPEPGALGPTRTTRVSDAAVELRRTLLAVAAAGAALTGVLVAVIMLVLLLT